MKMFGRVLLRRLRQPSTSLGQELKHKKRNVNTGIMRCSSSTKHPISRYPIVDDGDVENMPQDIKQRMEEVKEKVKGAFIRSFIIFIHSSIRHH